MAIDYAIPGRYQCAFQYCCVLSPRTRLPLCLLSVTGRTVWNRRTIGVSWRFPKHKSRYNSKFMCACVQWSSNYLVSTSLIRYTSEFYHRKSDIDILSVPKSDILKRSKPQCRISSRILRILPRSLCHREYLQPSYYMHRLYFSRKIVYEAAAVLCSNVHTWMSSFVCTFIKLRMLEFVTTDIVALPWTYVHRLIELFYK